VAEIKRVCAPVPPVVVGYSVGGFIAFEICCRLEKAGFPVRLLIMLDSSAVYVQAPQQKLLHQILAAARSNLGAAIARVPFLVAMKCGRLEVARVSLSCFRRLFGSSRGKDMRTALLVEYWISASRDFRLSRYEGRIVLFKAKKSRPRIPDLVLGWEPYARSIKAVEVEGDHWSMLRNPALIEKISAILRPREQFD
jgi:thioesterase domain-containing protein